MKYNLSPFKCRHFEPAIILLYVHWYLRYRLSYRDLEEFLAMTADGKQITNPNPGEVVWAHSAGVTVRRRNWRQCERTMSAYFVLDRLPPYTLESLTSAGDWALDSHGHRCERARGDAARGGRNVRAGSIRG